MIIRSRLRSSGGWRCAAVRRHQKVTERRLPVVCKAADTDQQGFKEITEEEVNARPLVTDYMGQFEHDLQWDVDEMGDSEPFGEYTPYNFIEYSEDDAHVCKHEYFRTINAPMQEVHDWFMDWRNIPPAFDLIDTLIPDDLNEDVAQVMMFYRWRRAPILQLLCTVRRQAADGDFIAFASDDGMPLVAIVRLGPSEEDPSATQVVFNIEYRLPTVLVDFAGKLGIHMHVDSILQQNLVVCKKLIEKDLTLDTLEAWYEEHRTDFYDGNEEPEMKEQLDNIPDNMKLEVEMYQDDEDKRQQETFIHNSMAMQELVEEGKYVECEQGWARADLDEEEIDIAEKATAYYRYFHDMPEKADQEQLANITEMLRVMTYSRGWQGVDGPPDPDSKPFATWDGVVAHWRGDARREEMKNYKPPVENEKVLDKPQDAVKGSSSTAGGDTEEGESEDEGDLQENVVEVQEVENAEVLPPEEVVAEDPRASAGGKAVGQEQDLDQFRGEDDIPDDNDPAVPMARLDIDPGPGLGPRDGFVYEGWRDAIDIVVDEDCLHVRQASDDDMLNIREIREDDEEWSQVVENKETGERVFEDQLAVEKYQTGGKVEEAQINVEEMEAEIKAMEDAMDPEERAQYEDLKAKLDRDDIPWNSPYDTMLEDEMLEDHDEIAILDDDDNVVGHAPILSRHDADSMNSDEAHDYMNTLADAAGLREEFEQMQEDLKPKEGLEAETFEEMQNMMDWQTKTAKKMGLSLAELTDAAVMSQEAALKDMVADVSDKMGVDPGNLMSTVYMFSDRTQRAADQAGVQHEEFLGAMFGAIEEAEEEDAVAAAKLGMDVPTYTDWAAHIHQGCEIKADKLKMTVEEYKEYAWKVIVEAQKRDWTDDPEIPEAGSSDEEFDEPPGDVDDDSSSSEALKRMFGLSVKDEEEMTPPEVAYESDTEEDGGNSEGSEGSGSSPSSPKPSGEASSER